MQIYTKKITSINYRTSETNVICNEERGERRRDVGIKTFRPQTTTEKGIKHAPAQLSYCKCEAEPRAADLRPLDDTFEHPHLAPIHSGPSTTIFIKRRVRSVTCADHGTDAPVLIFNFLFLGMHVITCVINCWIHDSTI